MLPIQPGVSDKHSADFVLMTSQNYSVVQRRHLAIVLSGVYTRQ